MGQTQQCLSFEGSILAFCVHVDRIASLGPAAHLRPLQNLVQQLLSALMSKLHVKELQVLEINPVSAAVTHPGLQALKHYGESVRLGHKAILQSLPRLLTLYFEFGSKLAASKTIHQRMRTAHTQVGGSGGGWGVAGGRVGMVVGVWEWQGMCSCP